jgi:hypothetical protein
VSRGSNATRTLRRLAWGLVLSAATASRVLAGPPFLTDDPEPVELHHAEFYLAGMGAHTPDGGAGSLPLFEFNYGVLPETQFHVLLPMAYASPSGEPRARDLGDVELGLKVRFVKEAGSRPQVGIFPLVELPTGDSGRGLGSGHVQVYLPLWIQESWGPWTSYGGVGWWRNPGDGSRDWTYVGWLLQRTLSTRLVIGGELFAASADQRGGSGSSGYNIGAVLDVTDRHHILVSAGTNFSGPRETRFYVGYQLTVGL